MLLHVAISRPQATQTPDDADMQLQRLPEDVDFQLRRPPGYLCFGYRVQDGYAIRCAGQILKILFSGTS
ncbi:unnamed protein product [Enterobius vermicularis]|uniref:Uncharacterized protein n=1 Tax=Enterobius vermicularis TaxID=51028 RepID=A0A0N4VPP0_ENTVE|nr:unnamed protein product [Enterobius vermicularis]